MKVLASSVLLSVLATSPMVWVAREADSEPAASVCPTHGSVCRCPEVCLKQLRNRDEGHRACARPVRQPDRLRIVSDCGSDPAGIGFMNLQAVFLPPIRTGLGDLGSGLPQETPLQILLIPPALDDPPPRLSS